MKPCPGRLVSRKSELSLQAHGTDPVLLAGDQPHGEEPESQRLSRAIEDRSGDDGCLMMTARAFLDSSFSEDPMTTCSASWALKTIGPSDDFEVLATGLIGVEPVIKLDQVGRILVGAKHFRASGYSSRFPVIIASLAT